MLTSVCSPQRWFRINILSIVEPRLQCSIMGLQVCILKSLKQVN
uniref:Uncharacterized protein n=1 Tax=Anguilla anguilla TaxID=7936 RepID=A0A0E9UMS6_ANGAN